MTRTGSGGMDESPARPPGSINYIPIQFQDAATVVGIFVADQLDQTRPSPENRTDAVSIANSPKCDRADRGIEAGHIPTTR